MSETTEKTLPENVLIEWTGIGAKHIATEHGNAFLIPKAVTPVPVAVWETARPWVANLIIPNASAVSEADLNHGRFIEHHVKSETVVVPEKKGPGGKVTEPGSTTSKITDAKDLADLPDSEARLLIGKIVDPRILQGYLESESLDDKPALKGAIERQIKEVESKGAGKKAK